MPVYSLYCLDCDRSFKGFVLAGTREPTEWVCSGCGGYNVSKPNSDRQDQHPLEAEHGPRSPCCP